MAATSGIGVSEELTQAFSAAIDAGNVRFIKVAIQNESLVPVTSVDVTGSLDDDLASLPNYLEDQKACYILVRLDDPSSEWLAVSYVPDDAKVKEKMLYASTRNALTKSLGSTLFTDALFATSKSDVTPEAYAAHKRHQAAPKPLSAREQEMADIKAAEREGTLYEGSRARQNHLGTNEVGYKWTPEAENAVKELGQLASNKAVVLQIDVPTETLVLNSTSDADVGSLGSIIPSSEPSFTLFAWTNSQVQSEIRNDILFIYSCPTSSPIKYRMVYSSGALSIYRAVKALIGEGPRCALASRKIETSDPKELNEDYFRQELGLSDGTGNSNHRPTAGMQKPSFARPKGPGRRG
ncbi:actin depolymerizing protein [Phlebopus sp. FC_14]|nr:actin depolymerizing protein [Phlebopus sp. FC_14]